MAPQSLLPVPFCHVHEAFASRLEVPRNWSLNDRHSFSLQLELNLPLKTEATTATATQTLLLVRENSNNSNNNERRKQLHHSDCLPFRFMLIKGMARCNQSLIVAGLSISLQLATRDSRLATCNLQLMSNSSLFRLDKCNQFCCFLLRYSPLFVGFGTHGSKQEIVSPPPPTPRSSDLFGLQVTLPRSDRVFGLQQLHFPRANSNEAASSEYNSIWLTDLRFNQLSCQRNARIRPAI